LILDVLCICNYMMLSYVGYLAICVSYVAILLFDPLKLPCYVD